MKELILSDLSAKFGTNFGGVIKNNSHSFLMYLRKKEKNEK